MKYNSVVFPFPVKLLFDILRLKKTFLIYLKASFSVKYQAIASLEVPPARVTVAEELSPYSPQAVVSPVLIFPPQ